MLGAEIVNQTGGPKSISAQYQRPRSRERKGENVEWQRIKSLDASVLDAKKVSREVASVLGRWLLFNHLTPLEAEAGRRYAYIVGRFERHFLQGRRTARSPSFERAYGEDQEVERHHQLGTIKDYEAKAKKARRHYDKLQKIVGVYADPLTKRNPLRDAITDMCCSDIEPPPAYRTEIAAVLRHVGHEFGVTVASRRGRPRKGRG